ncbi:hypothetical protein IPM62_04765 [Candidatus Woesebacteria bacterium]|nr:MAG: hypothetical protein IPM62_04765 [Candidatus Woesebacteria bacterium]
MNDIRGLTVTSIHTPGFVSDAIKEFDTVISLINKTVNELSSRKNKSTTLYDERKKVAGIGEQRKNINTEWLEVDSSSGFDNIWEEKCLHDVMLDKLLQLEKALNSDNATYLAEEIVTQFEKLVAQFEALIAKKEHEEEQLLATRYGNNPHNYISPTKVIIYQAPCDFSATKTPDTLNFSDVINEVNHHVDMFRSEVFTQVDFESLIGSHKCITS